MAHYLFEMLLNFDKCEKGLIEEYFYRKADEPNLRFLRDNGYIHQKFQIRSLNEGENIAKKSQINPFW